jgi:hypothetical protein
MRGIDNSREFRMFKKSVKVAICLCAIGLYSSNSFATIIVSGDANIMSPFWSTFPSSTYPNNNDRFFLNVLEGASSVAIVGSETYTLPLNSFYQTNGISSSIISSVNSSIESAGMLIVALPEVSFLPDELAALNSFVVGGGSVFFLGDSYKNAPNNAIINDALMAIGSEMTIIEDGRFDGMPHFAEGAQLIDHPLTNGVQSLFYAYASGIDGGTALAATSDGTPFISVEGFEIAVPEPSCTALFIIGLPVFLFLFRRRIGRQ